MQGRHLSQYSAGCANTKTPESGTAVSEPLLEFVYSQLVRMVRYDSFLINTQTLQIISFCKTEPHLLQKKVGVGGWYVRWVLSMGHHCPSNMNTHLITSQASSWVWGVSNQDPCDLLSV